MDALRLKKLRTVQFTLINSLILITTIVFTWFINVYSLAMFQRILGIVIIVLAVMNIISKSVNYNLFGLFPSMRELLKYEAEKLGKEFPKTRWTQISLQLFIGVMMLMQSFLQPTPPNAAFSFQEMFVFTIPVLLLSVISINIGLVYHVKKIDKGTTESLKGYNTKSILIGLAIGIPMGILTVAVSFFIAFLK